MADARAQVLRLVGGGDHDWTWLFSRWGVVAHCEGIASFTHGVGAVVVFAALGLAGFQLLGTHRLQTRRPSPSPQ